ncbi:TolC family protein [Legionella dresdenensis]|uniref:TolC family protein n=1 Tax=Legionella dresdenensis TaxID=450200 RepID=A0ABV8CD80_9GAMM
MAIRHTFSACGMMLIHGLFSVNIWAASAPAAPQKPAESSSLYRWVDKPHDEASRIDAAQTRLQQAITQPEFMLNNWLELPSSPDVKNKKLFHLSLREAILLALRYNPNIQNAELDRIIQRYQLRLAKNEFELQYALAGSAAIEKSHFQGVGSSENKNFLATPELNLKTKTGTQLTLNMENNVSGYSSYSPVLNFSVTQPLLRGFGKDANEAALLDALDNEWLNKINLQQAVIDQITQIINGYRALILSGNNLENQKRQLDEARKTFESNQKRIEAGQLEPTGNIQPSYQIESLNLMVEQAENDFKTAAQDLLQMIGLDPNMHIAVPSDINVDKITIPNLQQSIDIALNHNVQFLALKMQLRADERAYKAAKNQQLWQLDLGANVQSGMVSDVGNNTQGIQSIYNGRNVNESARLTLTIPINDISRRSTLINAKVKLEKDRINMIAARRALITSITNIINSIESQAKRYRLAEKQVKLAEQSYNLEKKKLQAGIASSLDVNNTQNQLIQAQAGLIGAKIAYLNQLSALQRLLGTTLSEWQIKLRYGS